MLRHANKYKTKQTPSPLKLLHLDTKFEHKIYLKLELAAHDSKFVLQQ